MRIYRNIILIIMIILGISNANFGQEDFQEKVLLKNKVGKKYVFNRSTKKDGFNEVTVRYLGDIKAGDSVYKIVVRSTIWGENKHTTGATWIYSAKNEYYGKYQLSDVYMLPTKIDKGELVFYNKNRPTCNPSVVTRVSFKNGIPEEIFIKCGYNTGDMYLFAKK